MKKHLILLCGVLSLFVWACKSDTNTQVAETKKNPFNFNPADSIAIDVDSLKQAGDMVPIETARMWIENYQQFMASLYKKTEKGEMVALDASEVLHGFTYRTEDLLAALGIEKAKLPVNVPHIRGYIGMTNASSPFTFKLLLLGAVDANIDPKSSTPSAGKDAYFVAKNKGALKSNDGDEGFVLDLNYPCPTLCPDNGNGTKKN